MAPSTRSRFITFEGGEGTGKSTQVRLLAERLTARGEDVTTTREPGGSPHAEHLREIILSGKAKEFGAFAEAAMFSAARIDHLRQTIRPALERGAWVICDRFLDSTRAYQGALGNLDPRILRGLEKVVVGETMPGLTILLDVPPEIGLERARSRGGSEAPDRFESEEIEISSRSPPRLPRPRPGRAGAHRGDRCAGGARGGRRRRSGREVANRYGFALCDG